MRATCPICREAIDVPAGCAIDVDVVHADADHRTQVIISIHDLSAGTVALAHVCTGRDVR